MTEDRESSARALGLLRRAGSVKSLEAAALVVALLPVLAAMWCVDVLPTHDGPKNLYAAHVRFHLENPRFAAEFKGLYPNTAFGFALLYGGLERLLGWRLAYELSWTLVIVGSAAAFFALTRALEPRRWPLGVAGAGAAMQWAVYMGFVNYVASVGLGVCALAVGLAKPSWTPGRVAAVFALLLAACAFHPVGAQMAGAALLVARMIDAPRGERIRRLGVLVLVGAPALFVTVDAAATLDHLLAAGRVASARKELPLRESIENFALCFLPGPAWRELPLLAAALLGVTGTAAALARRGGTPADQRPSRGSEIAILVVAVGAAAGAVIAPFHGDAWQYASPRFIPIAVLLGLALLPVERLGRRGVLAVAITAYAFDFASNGWALAYNVEWQVRWRAAMAGLGAPAAPGRTLLPIIAVPEIDNGRGAVIPYASPLRNLGELYGVARSAVTPYSFSALPGLHLIEQRGPLLPRVLPSKKTYGLYFGPGVDPRTRRRELVRLASFGVDYDDVLFVGAPEDAAALLELGYEASFDSATAGPPDGVRALVVHWVGCAEPRCRLEPAP